MVAKSERGRWWRIGAGALALILSLILTEAAIAQEEEPAEPEKAPESMSEVVVTGTRLASEPFEQPYAFYRHDRSELDYAIGRSVLDRMNYGPGVFIQATASNQFSPFIRGLTGEQSLLLLDGVRYSHAFMRAGPNQYAAFVTDTSIDSLDAILGSSSVVNGSDGLTGALDFNLADAGRGVNVPFSPWMKMRVDSANGALFQFGVDGRDGHWRYSIEMEGSDYHDRVGGKHMQDHIFGSSADRYDSIPNTSYEQIGGGIRLSYDGYQDHFLELKFGHNRHMEAPRPDGYFENTNNTSRLTRYFDPQMFTYLHLRDTWDFYDTWVDELQTTFWWHQHFEDQRRERISSGRYRREEKEDVLDAFGLDFQFRSTADAAATHNLTWGLTLIHENTSNDYKEYRSPSGNTDPLAAIEHNPQNWSNNTTVSDDSDYDTVGLYLQDSWDVSDRTNVLLGLRYSLIQWEFGDVDDDASDLTGSVRWLYRLDDFQNVFVGASKAFRAPNLTNLDGIVDRGSSGSPATGNADLDPEVSYTGEAGWRWQSESTEASVTVFYTLIDDYIQVDNSGSGQTDNVEDAELNGFEAAWRCTLPEYDWLPEGGRLSMPGSVSLVDAEVDIPQAGGGTRTDNISRSNRLYGMLGLRYDDPSQWWGRLQARWHAAYDDIAEDPSDPDSSDVRMTVAGSPDGSMPGYVIWDWSLGWESEDGNRSFQFFMENIWDKTYREVGSGADGPGRNLGVAAQIRF
jgi:hemoglobin/transferrin/lactoferrin receptor protein